MGADFIKTGFFKRKERIKNPVDFKELFKIHGVDAGLAASIFHFKEVSIADLKNYLRENGIPMRIL